VMPKTVNLSASDYVGAVERGLKEILMYFGNNSPLVVQVDEVRKHMKHLDEHLEGLLENQKAHAALGNAPGMPPANANSKEAPSKGGFLRN